MTPHHSILEWAEIAPWQDFNQIEQDLVITTALLKLFEDIVPLLAIHSSFDPDEAYEHIRTKLLMRL